MDEGNSASRKLFKLLYKLRKSQMKHGFVLHVMHVAGTRMIAQGTDGLSRGVLNKGALATGSIKLHVLLNLTALERSSGLEDWLKS